MAKMKSMIKKLKKVYIPKHSARTGYTDEELSRSFGKKNPYTFRYTKGFLKRAYSDNIEFTTRRSKKKK
jgi:hypothetical protein